LPVENLSTTLLLLGKKLFLPAGIVDFSTVIPVSAYKFKEKGDISQSLHFT